MECAVPCYIFSQQSDLFFPMWNLYLPVTNLNHLLHWTFNPTANLCSWSWYSKLLCLDCLCCRVTFDTAKWLYYHWSSLLSSGNVKGTEQLLTALFWTVQEGIVWLKDNTGVFLCSVCESNQCYIFFCIILLCLCMVFQPLHTSARKHSSKSVQTIVITLPVTAWNVRQIK